jgi:hypothetical protein
VLSSASHYDIMMRSTAEIRASAVDRLDTTTFQENAAMSTAHRKTCQAIINPNDPSEWLSPGESYLVGGFDWSWAFVIFREPIGFPHYLVSTVEHVWSCRTRGGLFVPWRRMSFGIARAGRLSIGLRRDDQLFCKLVNRLVLETFVGPCPDGMEGCHNNGNHLDNRVNNLRWDTHLSNMQDRKRHGRNAYGERNGSAKLAPEDIATILRRYGAGEYQKDIARDFGIRQTRVSQIVTEETTWPGVERPISTRKVRKKRKDSR